MLGTTVGIHAIQRKESVHGVAQKVGVVKRAELEMDVMGHSVEVMGINVL